MKTNKVLKWLYGVFMFLPMLAIGVTCAYVTFNKNAKDSYTSENVTNLRTISNNSQMVENLNYVISYKELNNGILNTQDLEYSYLSFNPNEYGWNGNYSKIRLYSNGTIGMYNMDTQTLDFIANIWGQQIKSFTITWLSGGWNNGGNAVFNQIIETPSKLDNAFYYAVAQFNESGFNKIDFVSFFDMFYENTNIWTTFANTYMNYVLFVSLAFFIPRVLYWFINLAFSLTDSFERKSQRW